MDLNLLNKTLSIVNFIFSITILSFLVFAIYKNKINKKSVLTLAVVAMGFLMIYAISKSLLQYFTWKGDGFARYFLPPYNDISYFFQYSFFKFFVPSLIAIFFSALILGIIFIINKAYAKKQLFSEYDGYLFFIGGVLVGWPYFLIYIGAVFLFALCYLAIASIENLNFKKKIELMYFWPIAALSILVFGIYISRIFNLSIFIV